MKIFLFVRVPQECHRLACFIIHVIIETNLYQNTKFSDSLRLNVLIYIVLSASFKYVYSRGQASLFMMVKINNNWRRYKAMKNDSIYRGKKTDRYFSDGREERTGHFFHFYPIYIHMNMYILKVNMVHLKRKGFILLFFIRQLMLTMIIILILEAN